MLLLFLIRVAELPPVWERAVHSVFYAWLSFAFIKFYLWPFLFGFKGGNRDFDVLIPDHSFFKTSRKSPCSIISK